MKFSNEKPAIYDRLRASFGISWGTIVITYGDTIYSKYPISEDLTIHEQTHIEQQAELGPEAWYDEYLSNPEFRLTQETEAYRNQIHFIRSNYPRDQRRKLEQHIYHSMATMYGNMCTEEEAKQLLA